MCGCAPWFIPRNIHIQNKENNTINNIPVCSTGGTKCFDEKSKNYKDDLIDRSECDCKNDCEMVHTFSTLQVNCRTSYNRTTNINQVFHY